MLHVFQGHRASGSWHLWASCFQQSELASFGPRDENMSQSDGSRNHKLNIAAFEGPCLVWSCLTSNTNTVCCCCCCCYIDMSAKITLVATTWHSDFANYWLPMRIPSWLSWFKHKHKNGCGTTTTENLRNVRKIGSQLATKNVIILVVTVTGRGDNPTYPLER